MVEPIPRLGDTIDDFCPRCRLLLNHAVASLVDGKVVKVICQTCHSEHPYRNAEVPEKKRPGPRAALFAQVLAKNAPVAEPAPTQEGPPPSEPVTPKKRKPRATARYISRHKGQPHRRKP